MIVNNLSFLRDKGRARRKRRAAVRLDRIRIYVFPTGEHPSTRMDCRLHHRAAFTAVPPSGNYVLYASRNKAVLISSRFIIQIVHATGDNDRPIRSQSESGRKEKSRNRANTPIHTHRYTIPAGCNREDTNIKEGGELW